MEALKNKNVGYAVAAVGVLVAIVGAFADALGIGAEGADGMGGKQLALLLAGLVVLGVGLAIVFLAGQGGSPEPTSSTDGAGEATTAETEAVDDDEAGTDDAADTADTAETTD